MIPIESSELEEIYSKTLGTGINVLAITSSNPGEGVSSLATALTHRHLLSGKKALFIDFNSDKEDHFAILDDGEDHQPKLITNATNSYALLGVPVPAKSKLNLRWRNPGVIEDYLEELKKDFDAIIIDSGAINKDSNSLIPTQRIIASADATLLVILSTKTTIPMINHSCQQIDESGGILLGCVMNNWSNPNLKQELHRFLIKLSPWLPNFFVKSVENWINKNRLLSLDL